MTPRQNAILQPLFLVAFMAGCLLLAAQAWPRSERPGHIDVYAPPTQYKANTDGTVVYGNHNKPMLYIKDSTIYSPDKPATPIGQIRKEGMCKTDGDHRCQ